ncbi:hypothetical protein SM0020_19677 [Sinorhizobium meliloti CCNWSX0020]|uniref:Uncharacterized protein n=1 Tax=Sinorhizobium meliloti CCNWSX0020 TaxID=1107881 RepID=H0G389_RHIML|nr:hypothetical protein SM0020_19677 [Sinorhizobium meliloti CCNWSX0020]PII38316.1 hypothetical protein T190_22465 [Sinorhizobium meliloti CCBAU 01290]
MARSVPAGADRQLSTGKILAAIRLIGDGNRMSPSAPAAAPS